MALLPADKRGLPRWALLTASLWISLAILGGFIISNWQSLDNLRLPRPCNSLIRVNSTSELAGYERNGTGMSLLDEALWEKGAMSRSSMYHLRRFMAKLIAGQPVTVAIVGGSVSWGHGVSERGTTDYGARLFQFIRERFPHPGHVLHNGAVPATQSRYMSMCVNWHVPKGVDLVVVEYAVNDVFSSEGFDSPIRRSFERLLRRLLVFPNRPAVVLLMFYNFDGPRDFLMTGEDQMAPMAQYYDLPWLSWRALVWEKIQRGDWLLGDIMDPDMRHPADRGHAMAADLLIGLLEVSVDSLTRRPLEPADEEVAQLDLIDPMYPGNHALNTEFCIMNDEFRKAVTAANGFEWRNDQLAEKAPKWGFIGENPGSSLQFTIDTNSTNAKEGSDHAALTISHLKSYENMGRAEIKCVSGCECTSSVMDAIWAEEYSQLGGHHFTASQHKECVVNITILEESSSKGHKVKLQGVVLHDMTGYKDAEFDIDLLGNQDMHSFI